MTHDKPQNEELPIAKDSPIEELVYRRDLATLTPAEQEKAIARVDEIKALLELGNKRTEADVVAAAKRLGLSRTWVYKLMNRYHSDGALSAMLGEKRGVRAGTSRIDPAVEKIIWDAIDEFYLTRKKNRAFYIIREVQSKCDKHGLKRPAKGTIRKRIKSVPARKADAAREGGHYARDKYSQVFEGFPMPKFPLSVVQIDHSPLDIQLLSEKLRLPIGKAYLTIAIDIYSRAILGFVVTLQAPSALSVGLCLKMVVEPKTDWLRQRKLDLNLPMWGKPDLLHVDNGSDFRCNGLKLGCYENGITCLLYTSPSPRDQRGTRMPSSA